MDESGSPYPGFVFRRDNSKYQLAGNVNGSIKFQTDYNSVGSFDLKLENSILYYIGNQVLDYTTLTSRFNLPLTFGASLDASSNPFRYSIANLNNVNVSVKYDNSTSVTLPIKSLERKSCNFAGWTGSNGTTPQVNVTINAGETQDKTYTANFDCNYYLVTLNANGGTINTNVLNVSARSQIGSIPVPNKDGYNFAGWYFDDETFLQSVSNTYVPTGNITIYAK